jgi:tRNA threonylcarbamoyladenosine biosynthesis protein TsaB
MKQVKDESAVPAPGLVLGIETATARGGVALVSRGGEILGETTLLNRESHSERLPPALAHLLSLLGSAPRELVAVAVSSGPGSFTGLRTGIATAKGLAFSLGIPLYGIPTVETLAANGACAASAPPGDDPVCAVINVRRGEVFRGLFRFGPAGLERLAEDAVLPTAELAADLPTGCLVVGEIPPALLEGARAGDRRFRVAPVHLRHPRAAVVALSGLDALRAGRPSELCTLLPAYVRAPDAEARPVKC